METCHVLFGSNLGDKERCFAEACLLINKRCGLVTKVSSAYETEPWGFEAEEWFLNRVIVVETELDPEEMLSQLLDIEADLGRIRHPEAQGYSSRTADLDLLYFGDRIIHSPTLVVPHPRLHLRRFALLPMSEVDPDKVHPVLHLTQSELLQYCPDNSIVKETKQQT